MAVINENMKQLPVCCKHCMYCSIKRDTFGHYHFCCAMPEREVIDYDLYNNNDKPSWCPLKEV